MDDLSALREEVARAIERHNDEGTQWHGFIDEMCVDVSFGITELVDVALAEVLRDPVRLVRVLTNQPCATCGGAETVSYPDVPFIMAGTCPACKANPGRLDLVGLLVENGTLEAVEQRPWGFDPTIHNPGAAAFRRSSKEGSA